MKRMILSTFKNVLFLLLVVLNLDLFGQPTEEWLSTYNGPASKMDGVRAMAIDDNNNVYVTGPSDGAKKGNIDYVTIKYNSSGQQLWLARYNGQSNGEDWPFAVAVDVNGNSYVTGRSIGVGNVFNYATVKYNSSGVQQWATIFNSTQNDVAADVKVDASGNVYVTGFSKGDSWAGGNAATTIKYNSSGIQQWAVDYDVAPNDGSGFNSEAGTSLAIDGSGNVYITGRGGGDNRILVKYNSAGVQQWVVSNTSNDGRSVLIDLAGNIVVSGWDNHIRKYDSNGALIWDSADDTGAAFWDMTLDAAGDVYATGSIRDNGASDDYWTVKYNSNGVKQWSSRYAGSANGIDYARSIAVDGSGNVIVTGYTTIPNGRNTISKLATIKYNAAGSQQWIDIREQGRGGFSVKVDHADNVYVAGENYTKPNDYDFITYKYSSGSNQSAKANMELGLMENHGNFQIRNYPNPFSKSTTIEYLLRSEKKIRLSIFDLSGREIKLLVDETQMAGIHRINFESINLTAGTYVCRLIADGLVKSKEMLIIK